MLGRRPKTPPPAPPVPAPAVQPPPALPPAVEQAARVEIELAGAREDLAGAEAELEAARHEYEAAADGARLSEAVAAKAQAAQAETVVDIGRRLIARLEVELADLLDGAADAAAAAQRAQLRAAAEDAARAYEAAFRAKMPALTAELRGLIRLGAVAELAREAAADKGVALPRVDAFRDLEGTPRVEVSRRTLDLWINPNGGNPFGEADQARIKPRSDGVGTLQGRDFLHEATHRRRFDEITFRPGTPGQLAPALYAAVALPCVGAGGPAGWAPLRDTARPREVLAALDALDAQASTPQPAPELRTVRRAVERARDVRVHQSPPPFTPYRGPYGSAQADVAQS